MRVVLVWGCEMDVGLYGACGVYVMERVGMWEVCVVCVYMRDVGACR